ncbi:hypothetical protein EOA25_04695 [Mesorhizobium sp. M2A.F.Ca.ET.040.01.1.1]|nr:hypothetical protein EOA25_04695 [Mesorhizobium sp. M2A.F.Ca.ET.040.01.1.1]
MSINAEIQQLLTAIDPPVFRLVDGAAAYAALSGEPKAMPAAYVITEQEVSGENERMTGAVLQRTEADIAVVIVTRNVADNSGGAAAADIETLKEKVRRKLVGYVPTSSQDGEPVTHIEGKLLRMKSGVVWQRELFGAAYYQEEQA